MKKFIYFFLIASLLTLVFVGCSSDVPPESDITSSAPPKEKEDTSNIFLDYGDYSDIAKSGANISTWNKLSKNEFPRFEDFRTAEPDKPMVALTFDDGPNTHTDRLLDIFKEYGGKGTFFVVGDTIDKRKETLKRMAEEGHEIGNHSWNHLQLTDLEEKDLIYQIMMTREKIYDVAGVNSHLVRPPYGAYNDNLKAVGEKIGVCYVHWSVDSLDWKHKNTEAIYNEIFDHVNDGSIILCHDLHKTTVDSMEEIIPTLLDRGYQLVTVSELLSYSKKPVEPGAIYYRR